LPWVDIAKPDNIFTAHADDVGGALAAAPDARDVHLRGRIEKPALAQRSRGHRVQNALAQPQRNGGQ